MTTKQIEDSLEEYTYYVYDDLCHQGEDEDYPMEALVF